MNGEESDGGPDGSGPLDGTVLELLSRRASTHTLVTGTRFEPDAISPRRLVLELDAGQYPRAVRSVRIDVRWYEGGEYAVHYLEERAAGRWGCSWDRHPKPEAPKAHSHPPPGADPTVDPSAIRGTHPLDVLFEVLDWIAGRLQELHD